jgi:hypothetical protein
MSPGPYTGLVGPYPRDPATGALLLTDPNAQRKVLTADVGPIRSQIALQDITGLGLAIGASPTEIWLLKYWLDVYADTASIDVNNGFTVPPGCTMRWGGMPGNTSNTPGFGSVTAATTPLALLTEAQTLPNGVPAAAATGVGLVAKVFGGGTAGTVQIRFAQNTSAAADLKILRGSVMEAIKVAS